MPSTIETRQFTIQPDLYAWPSFRLLAERAVLVYVVLLVAITFLLRMALQLNIVMAVLTSLGLVGIAVGLSFTKYKTVLRKPENRAVYRDSVVTLTEKEIRQDFQDKSFLAMELFAVKSFRDLGDFYFVLASPRHRIVVPKLAFDSIAESREFAERLQQAVRRK